MRNSLSDDDPLGEAASRPDDRPPWNHNIHFHRLVLASVPPGARSALDVGTGNGLLAEELRRKVPRVVGVDVDAPVLADAARRCGDVEWVLADALTHDFGETFDVVASIATLHHFPDVRLALERLRDLTSPGGVLVIVGLARETTLGDHTRGLIGVVQHQWLSRTKSFWEHTAPTVWPPPHSYTDVREAARELLPGMRWRQYALWRYAITWRKRSTQRDR
jgi:SAM-dependent methyltransferase